MADNTSDDVYNDPDNILADTDDSVQGGIELPESENDDLTQTIFTPELQGDDRGTIPELEQADENSASGENNGEHAEDMEPADEHDGDDA